jgi:DNA adenine methylase
MSERVKPILRWPGGKSRMLKHLLPMIPPHMCYVEPFAGGLAVLMAKERSKQEVINDINGDLVALYRNVQFHLPAILEEIGFFVSSRKTLYDFVEQPGLTEIQRAARFLLVNRTSFGSDMRTFAVSRTSSAGFSRVRNTELLGKAHERLDGVVIESVPYQRCLELYDSKDSFFFMDPPYLNKPTGAYAGFSEKEMTELSLRVRKLKGDWILTVDDSPFNRDLFTRHRLKAVTTHSGKVNRRLHPEATFGELIITPK